ncbi:MAG: hypothetical protein M3530_04695 [Thermoproteota archaeon]|nr:hypothetical protein [Thermoproteota archaeon]
MKKMASSEVQHTILNVIKDEKSLKLFNAIARIGGKSKNISPELDLSHKEYYTRLSKLITAGLVKRNGGKYTLTALGTIVYETQLILRKAVAIYWKLNAIDAIESSGQIGEQERVKLIKTIVNDEDIERVLLKT